MDSNAPHERIAGLSLRGAALVAGLAYLLNPFLFAESYAMPRLVVADPVRTLANLQAHPHLFGAAVLAYFGQLLGDVVMAWGLYVLLAPVHRALSLLASWLQLIYAAMALAALVNLALAYRLLFVPDYAGLLAPGALAVQVRMLIGGYRAGWSLSLVLFGLHLVVVGFLFARSTYLPRWLGWILIADGLAWVVDRLTEYVAPTASIGFLNIFFIGEVILMVWLLGWGSRPAEPEVRSSLLQ
ncbi:DUF4386 domain-containing protein [Granulicella arctica]|uniref:DUF4386 domain-containing protein n=1 Tax=Granulicella arctica TaxID=940613 RepID=UPI0021E07686|nr:DUF4386 domain-containing protein [Granulicella arctica]